MVNILQNNPSDFEGIKEWDYKEHFYTLNTEYGDLRLHYIDEGSENDKTVLLLHGEPDWGYIYRKFIDPCLLYTSPSPRDRTRSRMPSSA